MLASSHLFSFLDKKHEFTIHFLEGQKLIQDLAILHILGGKGFSFFRSAFLTIQPMVSLLKPGESLGLYIDSEDPFFRLKLETNYNGHLRTLLIPENFNCYPPKIQGRARLIKLFPQNKSPYTSIIELPNITLEEVVNQFLKISYQIGAKILIGENTDHALMVTKLPVGPNKLQEKSMNLDEYLINFKEKFNELLDEDYSSIEAVIKKFEDSHYLSLGSKIIALQCNCSKEKMMENLFHLYKTSSENLFSPGPSLNLRCDYCKAEYHISENDFLIFLNNYTPQA